MHITEIITKLREDQGLSQEELARRLHVTRQAVSKWERGKALPDHDNYLQISKEFGISISALMGAPERQLCQSCGMPLDDPATVSPGAAQYCKWCFVDGGYPVPGTTLDEMIEIVISHAGHHFPDIETARRFLRAQLSELERWQN